MWLTQCFARQDNIAQWYKLQGHTFWPYMKYMTNVGGQPSFLELVATWIWAPGWTKLTYFPQFMHGQYCTSKWWIQEQLIFLTAWRSKIKVMYLLQKYLFPRGMMDILGRHKPKLSSLHIIEEVSRCPSVMAQTALIYTWDPGEKFRRSVQCLIGLIGT